MLTLVTLFAAAPAAAGEITVGSVRVGEHQSATRVVFELSAAVQFRLFTLPDPYRVVIDLPEITFRAERDPSWERGILSGVRSGLFRPGTSRIVLDVRAPVRVREASVWPPRDGHPHRLVLDLEPVAAAAFQREYAGEFRPSGDAGSGAGASVAAPRPARFTVVLDAGHGGVDPGTIGTRGTYEKDITLAMALLLKRKFEATGRFKIVMTRSTDVFVRLRRRVEIAREAEADLFISLHADSTPNHMVRGASVYTLSETASDKETAALAVKENKADVIAGIDLSVENPDVAQILIDLAQRETKNLSAQYAGLLLDDLSESTSLVRRSHRFAGFAVLKAPDVPSVLVELGYLSNRSDERNLLDPKYRDALADAIVRATVRYFTHREELRRS